MALHLLRVQLHLRHVRAVGQVLDVGHQELLAWLSAPVAGRRCLVVLHDLDGLLLVADHQSVCRREAQGLLADVRSPHGDAAADGPQLGVQPASCRLARPGRTRLCGHLSGRSQVDEVRQVPEVVRLHLRLFHSRLDHHPAGLLPAHHLQVSGSLSDC